MALNLFVKCNSNITLKGIKLLAKAHNLSKNKTVNIVNTITCRLEHSGIIVDSLVNRTTPQLLPNKNHHIPVMHQEVLGKVFRSLRYNEFIKNNDYFIINVIHCRNVSARKQ